jgi:putative NADPH-quinone reductase
MHGPKPWAPACNCRKLETALRASLSHERSVLPRAIAPGSDDRRIANVSKRIVVIQGHPDPAGKHLLHALADAYAEGAAEGGHEVRRIDVARLEFPWLRTKEEYERGAPPPDIRACQADISWAEHLLLLYPLWLGTVPAVLQAFFEQVFRPGFAASFEDAKGGQVVKKLLTGKSARVVVTMGMPAPVYRWYFLEHSLRSLERNLLAFVGIAPIRESLIGSVENLTPAKAARHLASMRALGRSGT